MKQPRTDPNAADSEATKNGPTDDGRSKLADLWGATVLEPGFTGIPRLLLDKQAALGLDSLDLNIILQLARWWFPSSAKPPSRTKRQIAQAIGVDPSTVRKHLAALETGGLVTRVSRHRQDGTGQDANAYDLSGLIAGLTPFAEEWSETRRRREAEDDEFRKSKRARRR